MTPHRDQAALLIAAGEAADALELRANDAGPTMTFSRDEILEIAQQFARVTALATLAHLERAGVGPQPPVVPSQPTP